MLSIEDALTSWRKEEFKKVLSMVEQAISLATNQNDVVKQKECALFFDVSVNTLKQWVEDGCPEIRLESGMPLYSKRAITEWLIAHQK